MTKKELMEILKDWPDDIPVMVDTDFEVNENYYGMDIDGIDREPDRLGNVKYLVLRVK